MGRTFAEIDEEHQQKVRDMAEQGRSWAIDNGCYRDDEGNIANYFTIEEGKRKLPCWRTNFASELTDKTWLPAWSLVREEMVRAGMNLAINSENDGHYIGWPGESKTILATQTNHYITRGQTLVSLCYAHHDSGLWDVGEEYWEGRINSQMKGLGMRIVIESIIAGQNAQFEQLNLPRNLGLIEYAILKSSGSDAAD